MRDFQGRRRTRRFIYSKLTIIILLVVVFFMTKAVWGVYAKNSLAEKGKAQAQEELAELEQQEKELASRVRWLETDRGQEEEIRKNYAVLKPGEKMITVVAPVATSSPTVPAGDEGDWLSAVVEIFKNLFSW